MGFNPGKTALAKNDQILHAVGHGEGNDDYGSMNIAGGIMKVEARRNRKLKEST